VGGTDLDAAIAAAISAPVLLTMNASDKHTSSEIFNQAVRGGEGRRERLRCARRWCEESVRMRPPGLLARAMPAAAARLRGPTG
jgi:hypothetical protein